jgi:hypothetical protein
MNFQFSDGAESDVWNLAFVAFAGAATALAGVGGLVAVAAGVI